MMMPNDSTATFDDVSALIAPSSPIGKGRRPPVAAPLDLFMRDGATVTN
jgi:hypothetical protein